MGFVQTYIRSVRPFLLGWLTKIIYAESNISIGKNFRCDSVPRILIDKKCSLTIGQNVEFRRNLEIRVHGNAQIKIGNDIRIDRGVRILAANNSMIDIQNRTRIGLYSVLNGGDSITIGENVLISGFVYLQTSSHQFSTRDKAIRDQGFTHASISIKNEAWLGTHVVVMSGITIGQGAIIGSNAVVTKDVQAFDIMAGVPAKKLNSRK